MNRLVEALDQACPGCDPEDRELAYVWMGSFVRHLINARVAGREAEVRAVFALIESAVEPNRAGWKPSDESNLAVVGFLEDLQNGNLHPDGSNPSEFRAYLGPKSLDAWNGLNGFWEMVSGSKPV